jgi:phage terminase large subunit
MPYYSTTATKKIKVLNKRIRAVAGGTSASKTISILLYLIAKAQSDTSPTLTSIVSESFPHLKRGSMRDFLNILRDHGYFKDDNWNKTDYVYTFETGSKIEFFSADMPSKIRGPRRDRLFVNEGNNIPYEAWDQLVVRTKEFAFIDFNPTNEFWLYTEVLGKRDDIDFITLTYMDNEALDQNIVKEIETHRPNKNWWRVYGEGKLGEVEGKIYTNWQIIDNIPFEARLERYGLDFGYSQDPAAVVAIYSYNGGYILDEVTYQKGLSNARLADVLKNIPKALIMADNAEPKSIDEMKLYGLSILPVAKGRGSVNQGIQYIQDKTISITKRSINGIKEYRNYLWKTDHNGRIIDTPEGGNDHFLDATRYGFESLRPTRDQVLANEQIFDDAGFYI